MAHVHACACSYMHTFTVDLYTDAYSYPACHTIGVLVPPTLCLFIALAVFGALVSAP